MANERILIVDDNPFNVKLATYLLVAEGFELHHAETLQEVVAEMTTWSPQLILMDLHLPGTDGLTLTRRLRENPANADVVIVAFSADATPEEQQEALASGCNGFIAKPIDVGTFESSVRRHLPSRG